jgi:hypothetical protein
MDTLIEIKKFEAKRTLNVGADAVQLKRDVAVQTMFASSWIKQ